MANLNNAMNLPHLYNARNIDFNEFQEKTYQHSLSFQPLDYRKNLTLCLTPSEPSDPSSDVLPLFPNTIECDKQIRPDEFRNKRCDNKCSDPCTPKQIYRKYVVHKQTANEDTFVVNLVEPLIIDSVSIIEIENISIYTYPYIDPDTSSYKNNPMSKQLFLIGIDEFNIKNNTNDPNMKGKIVVSNLLNHEKTNTFGINYKYNLITDNGPCKFGYVSTINPGKYSQLNVSVSAYSLNKENGSYSKKCPSNVEPRNPSPIFQINPAPAANDPNDDSVNDNQNVIILSYVITEQFPKTPKNVIRQVPIQHTSLPQHNSYPSNYSGTF